jgi:branched-chain amino acid transport system substrate-binding protein
MNRVKKGCRVSVLLGAGVLLVATACSSSSKPASSSPTSTKSGGTTAHTETVNVGIITSLTGAQSATFAQLAKYTEDRITEANQLNQVPGVHINYVVDDNQSTPQGELAAAQDLVENKHVFAVIEDDALGFAAQPYLTAHNIPVVAPGFDGPEYGNPANKNLFSVEGSFDPKNHSVTTWGSFFKSQGVTSLAVLGYGDSPSSSATVKVIAASAKNAGIATPYVSTAPDFGDVDFTQAAIDIKNAGANGVATEFEIPSNVALITALKQAGVTMKAIFVTTGYGSDTLSDPAVESESQGVDYGNTYPPIELGSPGVKAFEADLVKYAGVTGDPGFAAETGWLTGDLFVTGLQKAGSNPTPASFISGLRSDTDYNPYNMLTQGVNYSQFGQGTATLSPGNCMYVAKLTGSTFAPISGANPVCGTNIPNSDQTP